ncbi:MAG TPA: ABC transporter permease [Terriglobia bacterium]|nr:ABC transporter permease [Terriglobia bacterium]
MHKLWLVIKREYVTRVRTKAFVIGTIAIPLFTVGIFAITIFAQSREADHTLKIAILDNVGGLSTPIAAGLTEKLKNGQPVFEVVKSVNRPASSDAAGLLNQVQTGGLDGYLMIPADAVDGKGAAEFHTKNPGEITFSDSINRAVSDAVIARRLENKGVQVGDIGGVVRSVEVKLMKVTAHGESEEKGQTFVIAVVMATLLYATLLMYGMTTMRSVMEEKTTRIIEVLVASVRPFYLLAGKILGVAAVAVTQYTIWTAAGGLLGAYGATMASAFRPGASMPAFHLPPAVLVYLVLFFLAGYLLFASLYAAVGAMVSNEQEAQQVGTPITIIIVAAFLLFNVILRDPSSRLAVILSLIPFISPILMILRIAMQMPPFWQIALSLGLSLLTTIGVTYLSAKIYRVGVLMYGKRPSLVELLRWMKYT